MDNQTTAEVALVLIAVTTVMVVFQRRLDDRPPSPARTTRDGDPIAPSAATACSGTACLPSPPGAPAADTEA